MADLARLALGTVQFGLPYGMLRPATRVADGEVAAILGRAWEAGVDLLDTAAAYGDAERVIGALCAPWERFSIVSKTLPLNLPRIDRKDIDRVMARVRESLRLLRIDCLDGLLVHSFDDLTVPGGEDLLAALLELKSEGIVRRLGVSIYDPGSLKALLHLPLDLVQLPCNVFDQRFEQAGLIDELAARGVEVHARSVYLQGLLLKDVAHIPPHLATASENVTRFHEAAAAAELSPAAAALAYVIKLAGVARVIVGVDSLAMLEANLAAYSDAVAFNREMDFSALQVSAPEIIDPRRWVA
jgi:aryl-alcohol dehydrogenase-like predicted oxidoreductase